MCHCEAYVSIVSARVPKLEVLAFGARQLGQHGADQTWPLPDETALEARCKAARTALPPGMRRCRGLKVRLPPGSGAAGQRPAGADGTHEHIPNRGALSGVARGRGSSARCVAERPDEALLLARAAWHGRSRHDCRLLRVLSNTHNSLTHRRCARRCDLRRPPHAWSARVLRESLRLAHGSLLAAPARSLATPTPTRPLLLAWVLYRMPCADAHIFVGSMHARRPAQASCSAGHGRSRTRVEDKRDG